MVEHSNYKKEGYFSSFKKEDKKKNSGNNLETFEITSESDRYKKSRMKVRIVKYEIKD